MINSKKRNNNLNVNKKYKEVLLFEKLLFNQKLSGLSTLKIGGKALLFFEASSFLEISEILKFSNKHNILLFVLGKGSNVLFDDKGFNGIVVRLEKGFEYCKIKNNKVEVGAATSLRQLSDACLDAGLSGLEFITGIPGSVGGGIAMNAGAFGCSLGDFVSSICVIDEKGNKKLLKKRDLKFSYRKSIFLKKKMIITFAVFKLKKLKKEKIKEKMMGFARIKWQTQPLKEKSVGCIFKNPEGKNAGKLIELAGLKGLVIGGAQVSEKHANFIINKGEATAKDILLLINKIQSIVYKKFKIKLEPELIIVDKNGRLTDY